MEGRYDFEMLSIGQVAKKTDISIETLRFYERSGLIPEPPRKESGYRQYPEEIVPVLRFIKNAKDLGFTLAEIKELLSLRCAPDGTKADVRKKTMEKIAELDRKILLLNRMKKSLEGLAEACDGSGPASECPILEAMIDESDEVSVEETGKKMMCYHYGHRR
jgi:MerR family transcriptional regulator, copper efflux regulator